MTIERYFIWLSKAKKNEEKNFINATKINSTKNYYATRKKHYSDMKKFENEINRVLELIDFKEKMNPKK